MKISAMALALWLLGVHSLPAQGFVLLESSTEGKTKMAGEKALLAHAYPPASLFKVLIAWEALEEKVAAPETKHFCADLNGRDVDMGEAMYFSSNDYFQWLAMRLNRESFEKRIGDAGWGGKNNPSALWLAEGRDAAERGGKLKVTVEQVHALTLKCMQGAGGENLKKVMRRPWNDAQSRVYGKSGAWGGAVWMTGYYDAPRAEDRKAVTVFVPYQVPAWKPAREKAQTEFYRALGQPRPKG